MFTICRVAAVPLFVGVYYLPFAMAAPITAGIFVAAASIDLAEGCFGTRAEECDVTTVSNFLDPVSSSWSRRLMVMAALFLLISKGPPGVPPWAVTVPTVISVGRKTVLSAMRKWERERKNVVIATGGDEPYKPPVVNIKSLQVGSFMGRLTPPPRGGERRRSRRGSGVK